MSHGNIVPSSSAPSGQSGKLSQSRSVKTGNETPVLSGTGQVTLLGDQYFVLKFF